MQKEISRARKKLRSATGQKFEGTFLFLVVGSLFHIFSCNINKVLVSCYTSFQRFGNRKGLFERLFSNSILRGTGSVRVVLA